MPRAVPTLRSNSYCSYLDGPRRKPSNPNESCKPWKPSKPPSFVNRLLGSFKRSLLWRKRKDEIVPREKESLKSSSSTCTYEYVEFTTILSSSNYLVLEEELRRIDSEISRLSWELERETARGRRVSNRRSSRDDDDEPCRFYVRVPA